MSKYKPGDIVRLKINPEQRVMILRVAWIDYPCDTSDCRYSYSARCGSGDTRTYADFELEEIPAGQGEFAYFGDSPEEKLMGAMQRIIELTNENVALKYRLGDTE